jgi:hypothetical protein
LPSYLKLIIAFEIIPLYSGIWNKFSIERAWLIVLAEALNSSSQRLDLLISHKTPFGSLATAGGFYSLELICENRASTMA